MSLFELSIKRPVFITMALLIFVVFGVVAFSKVGVSFFPNIESPVATVLTIYPGAGPETVEREVTEKIEEALGQLSGIDKLKSVSVDNVSQVIVVFELDMDADKAIQEVRDKVSRVIPLLPADAENPTVEKLDLGAVPILTLAITGPGRVDMVTKMARDRVVEPLQGLPGVGGVDIVGGIDREIKVWIDPLRLEAAGLAVTDVIGALAANNLDFPGGQFTKGDDELTVRVVGELSSVKQIARLPILDMGGRVVRVQDVARVEDGLQEARSLASADGERTVTMLVRKQSGSNSLHVAEEVKSRLARVGEQLPEGWSVQIISDGTRFTKASFDSVWFDMIFGGVLAVIIVFIFLRNLRSTLIAALALPTSVVATFAFIWMMGFTFNVLTMLALTLSIGLLIDDAIVVIENIYRHMEMGKPARQAALDGAKEIALAVLATTLSIAAVFLPATLSGGIISIMLYEFGMTVVFAVIFSLFVSFTLTPMLSARILNEPRSNILTRAIETVLKRLDRGYRGIIGWALSHRVIVVVLTLGIFAATIMSAGLIRMESIPSSDQGNFTVGVELPPGTAIARTEKVALDVAKKIDDFSDEVTLTIVKVGADAQESQNRAEIFVGLTDKQARTQTASQIIDEVREAISDRDDATISVNPPDITGGSSPMSGTTIQFNLRGSDLEELGRVASRMEEELSGVKGFVDVTTTLEGEKPEIAVEIDHERAAAMGIPTVHVGQAVRSLVGGVEASKFRDNGEEYDIRVRLADEHREREEQFSRLKVRSSASGQLVALSNLAKLKNDSGITRIDRQARQRQVTVTANLTPDLALSDAQKIVEERAAEIVPKDMISDWGGQVEMMGKSNAGFVTALLLAVILIYMVLAAQFESFVHPLVIMMSMPLSMIGAILAILITGQNMSMVTLIGILMLMGLVIKNGILLVDYTNTLRRRDGLDKTAALLQAGPTRLRPILMTTLAMVFGMMPVALSEGWGSELRVSMAVAVIGGLIASTLLTLVVVPVMYSLMEGLKDSLGRLFNKKRPVAAVAAAVLVLLSPVDGLSQDGPPRPEIDGVAGVTAPLIRQQVDLPPRAPGPSLTLEDALSAARGQNLQLQSAREEIAKANGMLEQAMGLALPAVMGGLEYTRMDHADTVDLGASFAPLMDAMGITLPPGTEMGDPLLINPQDKLVGKIQAGVPLIAPRTWMQIGAARRGVSLAEASIEDVERRLLLGVAQAYLAARMLDEIIAVQEARVISATDQLRIAEARQKVGDGMTIDVIRAKTDLAAARQDLLEAHRRSEDARDALGRLTGLGGLPVPTVTAIDEITDEGTTSADTVRRHTSLLARAAAVDLAQRQLDAAWMNFIPTLEAAWQGMYTFTEMADMGSTDRSRWAAMLTLSVPIYHHSRYGELDLRRAELRQARLNLEDSELQVDQDIRKARRALDSARISVETAAQQRQLAYDGLALVQASYKAGVTTSLDVTQALEASVGADVNLAAKRLQAQLALLDLFDATGGAISDLTSREGAGSSNR